MSSDLAAEFKILELTDELNRYKMMVTQGRNVIIGIKQDLENGDIDEALEAINQLIGD